MIIYLLVILVIVVCGWPEAFSNSPHQNDPTKSLRRRGGWPIKSSFACLLSNSGCFLRWSWPRWTEHSEPPSYYHYVALIASCMLGASMYVHTMYWVMFCLSMFLGRPLRLVGFVLSSIRMGFDLREATFFRRSKLGEWKICKSSWPDFFWRVSFIDYFLLNFYTGSLFSAKLAHVDHPPLVLLNIV